MNLVFPAGYSALGDRVIRDAEEATVASKGDRVVVSTMPQLFEEVPAGCSSAGVGTARAAPRASERIATSRGQALETSRSAPVRLQELGKSQATAVVPTVLVEGVRNSSFVR